MDALTFVNQTVEKVSPVEKRLSTLYWMFATRGEAQTAKELAETEKELKLLFSNPDEFKMLKKWDQEKIAAPFVKRQVELLLKAYTPNQLDKKTIADLVERQTEIENIFNNFRAELDGRKLSDNDLKEILKKEKNNERRREAWEATKQIGIEVAEKVKELARRRNKAAQGLGFPNHFEMSLKLQELDSPWLLNLFQRLKEATQKTFQKKIVDLHAKLAKFYGVSVNEVMPWHYDDPFAQQAPAQVTVDLDPYIVGKDILKIVREFYESIDLDISDVLERSDLFERKGKSQHAFCITMDKGLDVRVLANIRPNQYWTSTMLHELGHASYSKNIDQTLPYFLRDEAHTFATEAVAMLMERMLHHPHWLKNFFDIPFKNISSSLDKLIIARWVMVVVHFEKALYTNPDQDLNALWWRLVKEFQLIDKPPSREAPDWAAKIHIASYPCYYQNYLLGELFAAQIANTLEKKVLKKSLKEISFYGFKGVGKLLKENLFKMGCQWPWKKLVTDVTGQELDINAFVQQFCDRPG